MNKKHNINIREMVKLIQMTQGEVKRYAKKVLRHNGYNPILRDGFIYAEGNIPVILLAHMDTVFSDENKNISIKKDIITSTNGLGADDRAGVYGVLHIIREGFRPHVLFLEDEEIGGVGALKFTLSDIQVDAKYMIELDRQGEDDCVFYDCDNREFIDYVEQFGFRENYGSFSDISEIAPSLGVCAVNLSVGYYHQHTKNELLVLNELQATLDKVMNMLSEVPEEQFIYVEYKVDYNKYYRYYKSVYANDYSDYSNYQYNVEKEYEDFYGSKKIYEVSSKRTVYSKINKTIVTLYPIYDCFMIMKGGQIGWISTKDTYYIGEDDEIYDYNNTWIQGCELVDEDWNSLYVEDFMFSDVPF